MCQNLTFLPVFVHSFVHCSGGNFRKNTCSIGYRVNLKLVALFNIWAAKAPHKILTKIKNMYIIKKKGNQ